LPKGIWHAYLGGTNTGLQSVKLNEF